ncbi:MAG: hypothetical protein CMJ48_09475 [Planctomycetaceae bacterium]|nr:hypothetical protein [Planctomycetaceae bacterium]
MRWRRRTGLAEIVRDGGWLGLRCARVFRSCRTVRCSVIVEFSMRTLFLDHVVGLAQITASQFQELTQLQTFVRCALACGRGGS